MNKFIPILETSLPGKTEARKSKSSSIAFIGLNVVRAISVVAIMLVVASTIVVMVSDFKAVNAWIKAGSPSSGMVNSTSSTVLDGCDSPVIENSTIPNQSGGPFFSVIYMITLLLVCVVLFLSELGGPRCILKCFEVYLPPLGPAYGLATLGFTESFVSTAILSHHMTLFAQISAWILFVIGCANFCLGYIGPGVKTQRQIFSFENLSTLTPQTSVAYETYQAGRSYHHSIGSPSLVGVKNKFVSTFGRKQRSTEEIEAYGKAGEKNSNTKGNQESEYVDLETGRSNFLKVGKIPGVSFGGQAARREVGTNISIGGESQNGMEGSSWGGFGRKAEQKAKLNGYLISKPISTMPKL